MFGFFQIECIEFILCCIIGVPLEVSVPLKKAYGNRFSDRKSRNANQIHKKKSGLLFSGTAVFSSAIIQYVNHESHDACQCHEMLDSLVGRLCMRSPAKRHTSKWRSSAD